MQTIILTIFFTLCALGACSALDMLYNIKTVTATICQPRLDNISSENLTIKELLDWAEEFPKPAGILAFEGLVEFKTGEHCRFCRARAVCRAQAQEVLALAKQNY